MLNEVWTWWVQQLRSLLPTLRAGSASGDAAVLALAPSLGTVDLLLRRKGREGVAGQFPLTTAGVAALRTAIGQRSPVALHLPPGLLLDQRVTLPLAAEREPGRVLRYEMDRLTPFSADDLFWTWALDRRDKPRNLVYLRVLLTQKAPLLPVLDILGGAGIRPNALSSGTMSIPLDRAAASPWPRRVSNGLAAACVLLAAAAASAPFVRQTQDRRAVERRIAALRPAVEQAEALRRRAAAATAGTDVLAAQRAQSGDALEILAALTGALPDDTVLTDLAVHARAVTISGQSAAAARVIATLAADPVIRDPAFAAPVTRNDTTRTEGFSIRAEMRP